MRVCDPPPAYGGDLVDLRAEPRRAVDIKALSKSWPAWTLTPRQLCDLELLVTGALSPLRGFMTRADHDAVRDSMRLADGTRWPVPIVLDVSEQFARDLTPGTPLGLRDLEGRLLAIVHVDEVWTPETPDARPGHHPTYVGGRVEGIEAAFHYDYRWLRLTPAALRAQFASLGWTRVAALFASEPLHRGDVERTRQAAIEADAHVLMAGLVGASDADDVGHLTRVRCWGAVLPAYPRDTARLLLLSSALPMADARTVLWQAILARNYGCTHLILPPATHLGDDAQVRAVCEGELGIAVVNPAAMLYLPEDDRYVPEDRVPATAPVRRLTRDTLRELLARDEPLPAWFTFPEVARELRRAHPSRARQGFTVFFTGLSGAGKSTIAHVLRVRLLELNGRAVRVLDGDRVRAHLTSELGFSKPHRDLNIQRIGFVASEITQCGGVALCAAIAPYDVARRAARAMIAPLGGFFLVHVSTPLSVCERRDVKGLYARARSGGLAQFTGISDPYEVPADADLVIDTTDTSAEDAAERIVTLLGREGYLDRRREDA